MEKKSFEEKIEFAKEILNRLMNPEITLEESVKLYKEGIKAIREAEELLEKAKTEIIEIEKDENEQ
ncbi:exodeoxyribonuclease VII small subunit [Nitrosophilus alvini]|uniref:exodeoxyribonuclease VII small subunit n=1 Tax=Nitrosophilus alvini TaxID=2714855 RepID=UPI00190D3FA4|nr:exodeoxyribonuclease VII small subunit [Nitrosophilus alvini]